MSRVLRTKIALESHPSQIRGRCTARPGADTITHCQQVDKAEREAKASVTAREREDHLRALLESVHDAITLAERSRQQSLDELQELAVELATCIAGTIVFRTIHAGEHDVAGMVSAAIDQLGVNTPLELSLHPADLARLNALCDQQEVPHPWHSGDVTLRAEGTIPQGHCRASNGSVTMITEGASRLEDIRRLLWEGLDDAQDERRQAANLDSPLKRFPDRRETA